MQTIQGNTYFQIERGNKLKYTEVEKAEHDKNKFYISQD